MPNQSAFVHCHVHTEYSLVNGIVQVKPLVNAVAADAMPACAVTDQTNLFSIVKFYRAALSAGIKPIIGADFEIYDSDKDALSQLVLLAQNETGYRNLCRLVSKCYQQGQDSGVARLYLHWLDAQSSVGLIALSGGRQGNVGQALLSGNHTLAASHLTFWNTLFPQRFYLELQRTGRVDEERYIHAAVSLANEYQIPVVATNDVHFLKQEDFEAHEARVCINEGRVLSDPRRPKHFSDQQYLRTTAEMVELFADIPEALENSVAIAKRCNLMLHLGENFLPDFPVPADQTIDSFFRLQSQEGLEQRLQQLFSQDEKEKQRPIYEQRLQHELGVIISMGFPGYFLIVADFIRWAKENGVPVGPGRGSGAGSLVAYALQITDLDPIEYDLLFERFLNPERVSLPDFDVDFCMEGRDRVIEYVSEHYGREKVSQIITYGRMKAKAVVRDVGRVLSHPYGFVDKIAKLIPFDLSMTLDKALDEAEELRERYDNEEEVKTLIDLAKSLEGTARNAGRHAGGVVIAPSVLTDFSPLYCERGGTGLATQFDKDDVEAVGLVKFDFLGLRTLTIIDWAVKTVNQQRQLAGEAALDILTLPVDDEASFTNLKNSNTTAVFQLESRGMKDLIKRLQPDCFEDIIALVALFRPGPLQSGMVDDFINRKHGRAKVEYPHPDLEPILEPTYGVILYQEQVMQIAQVLAGYTLGGADMLRRAMGKKKPEEMAKQRTIFLEGSKNRGVDLDVAGYIFDLMEKFAGYGFNKSHSAAYALLSYQTVWLKTHYTPAFMAAVLSADMDNTEKIVILIEDCREMDLHVRPPDVNQSAYAFTVSENNDVIYGLGAIKGVGSAALEGIINEVKANGVFKDLFDLCRRIDMGKVNKRVLEALIKAGALDKLGENRASLLQNLPKVMQMAEQTTRNNTLGQVDLFGGLDDSQVSSMASVTLEKFEEWPELERLKAEKSTLGLYLTGHPISQYEQELKHFISCRINDLGGMLPSGGGGGYGRRDTKVVIAGLIVEVRNKQTARGRMAFVTLDDRSGRTEMVVFGNVYEQYREYLKEDQLLVVKGGVSVNEYSGGFKVSVDEIYTFDEAREHYVKHLTIHVDNHIANQQFITKLTKILDPFRQGTCQVRVHYQGKSASAQLILGQAWWIHPKEELIIELERFVGLKQINIEYKR